MQIAVVVKSDRKDDKIITLNLDKTLENLKLFIAQRVELERRCDTNGITELNQSLISFCDSFLKKVRTSQLLDLMRYLSILDSTDKCRLIVLTNQIEETILSRASF